MNNFKQYLLEGRDAPLYHGTGYYEADKILLDNILYSGYFVARPKISFSRDLNVAKNHSGNEIVFMINQTKLSQRYKIDPFNYYQGHGTRVDKIGKYGRIKSEQEETVSAKAITKFNSYIIKIFYFDKSFLQKEENFKKYPYLSEHPLLELKK
jgi:hypothetical protein